MRHHEHHLLFVMKAVAQLDWCCRDKAPPIIFTPLIWTWPLFVFFLSPFLINGKTLNQSWSWSFARPCRDHHQRTARQLLKQQVKFFDAQFRTNYVWLRQRQIERENPLLHSPCPPAPGPVQCTPQWRRTDSRPILVWTCGGPALPSLPSVCDDAMTSDLRAQKQASRDFFKPTLLFFFL